MPKIKFPRRRGSCGETDVIDFGLYASTNDRGRHFNNVLRLCLFFHKQTIGLDELSLVRTMNMVSCVSRCINMID